MKKILVAEDEAVLRMLITDSLEDEGYETDTACDGEEALAKINETTYDLLILDHMMPRYTGLEVIAAVRTMPGKNTVKTLMLSAKSQHADMELALKTGADAFMSKPFSPAELARKVSDLLND